MMYVRYAFLATLIVLFKIICWLGLAIVSALFVALFNLDRLPGIWALVQTHDDDVYGSNTRRKHYKDPSGKPVKFLKRFTTAVWWLYRNPGYGLAAGLFGFAHEGATITLVSGDLASGMWHMMTDAKGRRYFSYRRERVNGSKYSKFWIGWKFNPLAGRHMIVFDYHPSKTVQKK